MVWSRTNQLIIAAAERLGARGEALSASPTDFFVKLVTPSGEAAVVSKTRSPWLTQVAQTLSNNKHVSREVLGRAGLPVVADHLVDGDIEPDALETLVTPWLSSFGAVVVKPNWGNRARGVATELDRLELVAAAVRRARAEDLDEEAIIEPHVAGTNLRVAVIGGRFEAAAEIVRPRLVGDGRRTLQGLVDELNEDPRRGSWQRPSLQPLDHVELEPDLVGGLELRGLRPDGIVPAGVAVELLSDELETIDWTERLHSSWVAVAVEACRRLGVDVGGVDLRGPASDFESPRERATPGTGLLEVNVLPALHVHALPTQGTPRPVFDAFVAYCLSIPGAPAPQPGPQP